ncbi:MAG TPA: formate dehydrogenase subunit gamma [Thiolinea sp.]|nr:formate dehydrogenase subunit gamma [Thiolinea sp.]
MSTGIFRTAVIPVCRYGLLVILPVLLLVFSATFAAAVEEAPRQVPDPTAVSPGIELWNAVRERQPFDAGQIRTQPPGGERDALINIGGEAWRQFRMQELIPVAARILAGVAVAILLFRLLRGKIPIRAGRSGEKIHRFSGFQRLVHWTVAILFVGLAVSGLVMLFGRYFLIPWLGPELGGPLTYGFKRLHDFSGPAFGIALVVMIFTFMKGNFPTLHDIKWVFKAGGLLGGHAPAGRYNAGEKGWYWLAASVGMVVVVSGLVLDFPNSGGLERDAMIGYHRLHSIGAVVMMAVSMGHIYMGTIAMEGAFECMATGYCDSNWAKEHHDRWYAEITGEKIQDTPAATLTQAPDEPPPARQQAG